jgi:hypothetical protein
VTATPIIARSKVVGLAAAAIACCGVGATHGIALAATPTEHYCVMVFSRPVAGKDAEFNAWYDQEHIPDMLSVPGFEAAQRFVTVQAGTPTSTLPPYLVIYDVATSDLDATNAEVKHRMVTGLLRRSDAIDYAGIVTAIFSPLGPPRLAKRFAGSTRAANTAGHGELKPFELIVFSNPESSREDEYNRWYDTIHIPDVLHVPGFISGQRFKLAENESPGTDIPRYLVRFEFKSYDLDATVAELVGRIKSGKTRMSTAMAPDSMVYFDSPLGPRVSKTPAAKPSKRTHEDDKSTPAAPVCSNFGS